MTPCIRLQKKKNPAEAQETLNKLDWLLKVETMKSLAAKMGYSYSYVHQVHNRKLKPGKAFCQKVNRLYQQQLPMITVTFKDPGLYDYAAGLTMEERRKIFICYYRLPGWLKRMY